MVRLSKISPDLTVDWPGTAVLPDPCAGGQVVVALGQAPGRNGFGCSIGSAMKRSLNQVKRLKAVERAQSEHEDTTTSQQPFNNHDVSKPAKPIVASAFA